jgi:hypothetical protein
VIKFVSDLRHVDVFHYDISGYFQRGVKFTNVIMFVSDMRHVDVFHYDITENVLYNSYN